MQKLAEICVRRPVFATMLIMALVVMGLDAYRKLGVDFFPKVEFPIVSITTTLRGAAPEEVESQVTKRIEEAVNTISGIDELRSNSSEGISIVSIQFVLEKDPEVAAQEVRDKISTILGQLPQDADPPVIDKIATDASPVLNVVISSNRDLREITKLADDQIKKNIESLPGVGQVKFVGERQRQIQVWLDGDRLAAYNLNIDQVRSALAAQNIEVPGGRIDQGNRELSLRTLGRVEKPADFARIVVGNVGGTPVRISDIGEVLDGYEEPRSVARLDGQPAVVLEIRKQAGTNTLDVIQTVKDRISQLQANLPQDLRITYSRDQSDFIRDSFHAVQEHLILGGVLAGVIVLLFIRSWRATLISAIAIPTSIVATYTLMQWMGFSLNQITMLALTLVVGIVIDDAIVVLENIFRFMEEKKMTAMEAAVAGTRDIGLAVMATTLSLVIIFLPVALMEGIVGRFMSSFGYTAAFAIMVSLLVSFTLTPMLCSRFLKAKGHESESTKDTWLFRVTAGPYRRMLMWSMRHRWVIGIVSLLVILSSGPLFMMVGKDFLPTDDQSEFEVLFRMPAGSSLEGSEQMVAALEQDLKTIPGVKYLLSSIGADIRRQVDRGSIYVQLVPMHERKQSQKELMLIARERMKKYPDIIASVQLPQLISGAGVNADLMYYLQGPDLAQLEKYTDRLKARLRETPGVVDVDSSYEAGKPEFRAKINRDRAADLGVSVASVATALRTLVGGDEQATTYKEGDDRYDVQLRVKKEFRDSPQALDRLYVPSSTLGNTAVSNVAHFEPAIGPTVIERYNRQRQILITANLVQGQALSNVLPIVNQTVDELNMPPGYSGGEVGRSKEFGRAAVNYMIALILSIVFMYMILAAQFESFIDPVTILLSLPLSVPFALVSLLITKENFSIIYTSLGILVLFGIVKKNSILQIDHVKNLRREGMPRLEAILHGCEDRLRPILMTTAALVAGMLPLALGGGPGSGSRRTVAIVVIGGQTLCLLLTLLVTPVAYSFFDDIAHSTLWSRLTAPLRRFSPRRAFTSFLGALLLCALLAPSADAKQIQPPARIGVGILQVKMTLEEAIERALKNNLEIEIERQNRAGVYQGIKAASGFYDPIFRWQPSLEKRNTPVANVLQAADGRLVDRFFAQNFSFRQPLPWSGSSFHVDFDNNRQSTNNPFAGLNPYYTSRLMIGITQPLLRDRGTDQPRAQLRISRKQASLSEVDLKLKVIDVVTRVQGAYWDLVAARQDAEVKRDNVEWAREQVARSERQIEAGTLAPVELSGAQAELERRLDTYIAAVGVVTDAENAFKTLVASGREDTLWGDEIVPTDPKTNAPLVFDDLRTAIAEALRRRPELESLGLQKEVNDVQKQLAQNQTKPQLNLNLNYINQGLGGELGSTANPFSASNVALYQRLNQLSAIAGLPAVPAPTFGGALPSNLVGGLGTALGGVFGGDYRTLAAGFTFDFNVRNRTAEAQLSQTVIGERRISLEKARVEQQIEAQVRSAMQFIETARQRITAAEASARAAKEKLDSEVRLFNTGESTNFLVLTRQNEYSDSRRRVVVAQLEFNRAVARLEQAVGATLEQHKITVQ
ncbi:MAG: efflux RND transporter permease subunit [Bryobacteraceae bacterium]|nr:efflux RND transporter permease subunit [Bryobacteraceae bacterium]